MMWAVTTWATYSLCRKLSLCTNHWGRNEQDDENLWRSLLSLHKLFLIANTPDRHITNKKTVHKDTHSSVVWLTKRGLFHTCLCCSNIIANRASTLLCLVIVTHNSVSRCEQWKDWRLKFAMKCGARCAHTHTLDWVFEYPEQDRCAFVLRTTFKWYTIAHSCSFYILYDPSGDVLYIYIHILCRTCSRLVNWAYAILCAMY